MALLTDSDYGQLRDYLYKTGQGKEELKARPSLPAKPQIKAAFQAVEDFWETNRTVLKAQIDTAIGFTTTNALARKITVAWLFFKVLKGG